jgi:glucuronoarabinoxylan endo-1,4-beta-xylanase
VNAQAQTYAVKGVVSASTMHVRYASVIFIDNSDTTKKVIALTDTSGSYSIGLTTSVKQTDVQPVNFELEQNYPNPFSSSTAISYQLNKQADVKVTIYDILGREIKKFTMGDQAVGAHGITWDGKNNIGTIVSRGIYFYQLQAKGETRVRKMLYGFGGNNVIVPPAGILAQKISGGKEKSEAVLGGTFSIRIENTDSTFPAIIPQQFSNIVVLSNTTQDFAVSTNAAIIFLNDTKQVISGFGGMNNPGWGPVYGVDLTPVQVNMAFANGPGQIGLSILRIRVSSDSTQFKLEVPTAQLAELFGAKVFATPWSPPASMKSNNNTTGGTLNTSSYSDFAIYLKKFADYMSTNDASLYAISIQNEPDASVNYESCSWNSSQLLNFVKNNTSAVGTKIMVPEAQNFNRSLSDPILNDSIAAANVSIIAGHLYGGGLFDYPLARSKGKEVWMTEHITDTDSANIWSGAMILGKEIHDCMVANFNAYVWWYIRRFYGLIDDNSNVTKRGYVMSQYARFVRPGFVRVNATANPRSNVYVTAYMSGSKVVIVVINRGSSSISQTFIIQNGNVTTFTPYVTLSTQNCAQGSDIAVSSSIFNTTLNPSSFTTFVSN